MVRLGASNIQLSANVVMVAPGWLKFDDSFRPMKSSINPYIQYIDYVHQWASYQIRKIAGCACAGNAGNVSPATDFKWNR